MIILNSYKAAADLLDHRYATYSGRPHTVFAGDIIGWGLGTALLPYNARLKKTRRMLQEGMSAKAMMDLWPLQEREAIKFVHRLLDTPKELHQHILQTAGATVLKLTYGYNVEDRNDRFLVLAETAVEMFSQVTTPGALLVDVFPWLQYVPWLKTRIRAWRKLLDDFVELPMQYAREHIKSGDGEPCLVSRWLERKVDPKEEQESAEYNETLVKWGAMSLYGGGSDTTVSAISSFFAAMVLHPDIQAKAQTEIVQVIGTDRLPTYADRKALPYIEALYKEVMRFHPVAPIGIPHRLETKADDEYQGMRIPGGATIFANIWKMLRDPSVYSNATTFNPERFIGPTNPEQDPEEIVFGFGRRLVSRRCPRMNIAHSSVWLSIALTLATYDITPALGIDGNPKLPSGKYTTGTISHPEPFECTITPRSPKAIALIKEASEQ